MATRARPLDYGSTPLGYGAAVLPQSTFDPVQAGREQVAIARGQAQETKKAADQQLQDSLESVNPNLGKLKWTGAYLSDYENKIGDWRKKNIDWYKKQDGRLSAEQIANNQVFKEQTKAEFDLLNTEYDKYLQLRNKVLTDKKLNTPENRERLKKFSDPAQFDKEKYKKAGNILRYITENPLEIVTPKEPADLLGKVKKIKEISGQVKTPGGVTVDPDTNLIRTDVVERNNLAAGLALGRQEWIDDPTLADTFDSENDWLTYLSNSLQRKSVVPTYRKGEKPEDAPTTTGRVTAGPNVKVTYTEKPLKVAQTQFFRQNIGLSEIETKGINEEIITTGTYNISKKDGKPVEFSTVITGAKSFGAKGFEDVEGGNYDFRASGITEIPTTNTDININDYAILKNRLKKKANKQGVIPAGTFLNEDELKDIRGVGLDNRITDEAYVVAEGKRIAVKDPDRPRERKVLKQYEPKTMFVPISEVTGQLQNLGINYQGGGPRGDFELSTDNPDVQYVEQNGVRVLLNTKTKKFREI